jgi:hypothetical protein
MRILTTFNDHIYELSGKKLLDTIEKHMPNSEVWVYEEVSEENWKEISSLNLDVRKVSVNDLPEVEEVFTNNKDIIDPQYGGKGEGLNHWNWRWYGWFKKIAMQYDAITRKRHRGTNVFVDADIRFLKPISESFISENLEKPIGLFQGDRNSVESGFMVVDGTSDFAIEYYKHVMSIFLGQGFRRLPRWDDSFIFAQSRKKWPHIIQDFGQEVQSAKHVNSNGHEAGETIIPFTNWGIFIEHDKGAFLRDALDETELKDSVPKNT